MKRIGCCSFTAAAFFFYSLCFLASYRHSDAFVVTYHRSQLSSRMLQRVPGTPHHQLHIHQRHNLYSLKSHTASSIPRRPLSHGPLQRAASKLRSLFADVRVKFVQNKQFRFDILKYALSTIFTMVLWHFLGAAPALAKAIVYVRPDMEPSATLAHPLQKVSLPLAMIVLYLLYTKVYVPWSKEEYAKEVKNVREKVAAIEKAKKQILEDEGFEDEDDEDDDIDPNDPKAAEKRKQKLAEEKKKKNKQEGDKNDDDDEEDEEQDRKRAELKRQLRDIERDTREEAAWQGVPRYLLHDLPEGYDWKKDKFRPLEADETEVSAKLDKWEKSIANAKSGKRIGFKRGKVYKKEEQNDGDDDGEDDGGNTNEEAVSGDGEDGDRPRRRRRRPPLGPDGKPLRRRRRRKPAGEGEDSPAE